MRAALAVNAPEAAAAWKQIIAMDAFFDQHSQWAADSSVGVLAVVSDFRGGIDKMVRGKTVAVKINMTGGPTQQLRYIPKSMSFWTHPQVVGAAVYLLGRAGARRIRIVESAMSDVESLEQFMLASGWDPA